MNEPIVPREEAQAALETRRELGSEFEPHVVDSFVARIEGLLAERRNATAEAEDDRRGMSFIVALVSLGTGIPMTAIALSNGGLAALAIVWAGIVLVNLAVARAR